LPPLSFHSGRFFQYFFQKKTNLKFRIISISSDWQGGRTLNLDYQILNLVLTKKKLKFDILISTFYAHDFEINGHYFHWVNYLLIFFFFILKIVMELWSFDVSLLNKWNLIYLLWNKWFTFHKKKSNSNILNIFLEKSWKNINSLCALSV